MHRGTNELYVFLAPSAPLQPLASRGGSSPPRRGLAAPAACVCVRRVTGPVRKANPGSTRVAASKNLIGFRSRSESAAWEAVNLCVIACAWCRTGNPAQRCRLTPAVPPSITVCCCPVALPWSPHVVLALFQGFVSCGVFCWVLARTLQSPIPGTGKVSALGASPPSDGGRSPWGFASWDYVSFCIVLSVGFFLLSHLRLPSPRSLAGLSAAKRKFADSLNEFKFRCIGDAETDDEICIGESCALPGAALKPHSRALSRAGRCGERARGCRIRPAACLLSGRASPGSASAKPSPGNQLLLLGLNLALTNRKGRRLPVSGTI